MTFRMVFGDQLVALPEELCGFLFYGFADTSTKRVIAIACGLAVGLGEADQPVLAVVAVLGDECMTLATPFSY
ncbi:hypothetical protein [Pseudomonas sp. 44 R 15]|nr:hypothetical protein [Pseudomonas sp. 44 R 15]